jgi:serine/threonine protein kinase/CRP-like cAMP-binding protein
MDAQLATKGLHAPTPFGKFELIDRIAVGGMAEIFLARSQSFGGVTRTCVIKRILPEYSADSQFVSMFIDEARITIGLDHPNIVKLIDFGQHAGTYYMAMEYVDGYDLVDILRLHKRQGNALPFDTCAFIALGMCAGLHAAHTQKDYRGAPLGVVHRDVSPHNVLISSSGEVKVADFGIASAKNKLTVTLAGTLKGKFAYMAPEQCTGNLVDARTDVWATGVTLFEMLTSSRLFASETPMATIHKVLNANISPAATRRPGVPAALEAIVGRALERDVKKRYQSAAEMADDLRRYLAPSRYSESEFARFLGSLEWVEDTAPSRRANPKKVDAFAALPSAVYRAPLLQSDPEVRALVGRFQKEPDVWLLVDIAAIHEKRGETALALGALRTAAAVFASRALLVQSICAFGDARKWMSPEQYMAELLDLANVRGANRKELAAYFRTHEHGGAWDLVSAVDAPRDDADDAGEEATSLLHLAPLFGRMPAPDYARLVNAIVVRDVAVGTAVLAEGQTGASLFAVGRGRLVVSCHSANPEEDATVSQAVATVDERAMPQSERVYLSALADGDFFGEFSYLTGRPRSATVEAILPCRLLEVTPEVTARILRSDPAFTEPLLEFYKERVGELMMAKNPIFALLPHADRKTLLAKSVLVRFSDEEDIVRQGEISEDMYFIKHGEVEVYRDEDGLPVFINKLREGDFFGEMATIHGTPRSASVRAMGDAEVFRMKRADLEDILDREPRLRRLIETAIEKRASEATARLLESRSILMST